jgi:hypothetical protein
LIQSYTVYIDVYWQRIFGIVQLNITPPMFNMSFPLDEHRRIQADKLKSPLSGSTDNRKYL